MSSSHTQEKQATNDSDDHRLSNIVNLSSTDVDENTPSRNMDPHATTAADAVNPREQERLQRMQEYIHAQEKAKADKAAMETLLASLQARVEELERAFSGVQVQQITPQVLQDDLIIGPLELQITRKVAEYLNNVFETSVEQTKLRLTQMRAGIDEDENVRLRELRLELLR